MSAEDPSSYRPKSPDLSFFSGSTEPAPLPPVLAVPPSLGAPPQHDSEHHHQPHHQPHQHQQPTYHHHEPHIHQQHNPYLQQQEPAPDQHSRFPANPVPYEYPPTTAQPAGYGYGSPAYAAAPYTAHPPSPRGIKSEEHHPYLAGGPSQFPAPQPSHFPHSPAGHDLYHHPQHEPPFSQPYNEPSFPQYTGSGAYVPSYYPADNIDQASRLDMPQKPIKMDPSSPREQGASAPRVEQAPRPPPINLPDPSPVRTKFPTARIKRIMQADEEVGKVAQQTPIAVGKALEMFMVQMVLTSADVAKEKGSKRVTAQMLKQVVETDEQWDFLRDIVSKVENNEKAGKGGNVKAESESEEEEPKKKKGGRKRKTG
ncbi:hypothetical protein CC79DRAFT_1399253 [Sarocladium strictum]